MRYRLLIWSLLVLCAVAVVSTTPFDRVVAQKDQPPTKAALPPAPTKPPADNPPTKAPVQPTAVPATKVPLSTAVPTKTAWPTPPTNVPTKTLVPTATEKPTLTPLAVDAITPTSSMTSGTEAQSSGSVSATPTSDTAWSAETGSSAPAGSPLIGMVFDDVNGDGVQEENEPGLAGIAVIVATSSQAHTLITDASGAYQVTANPRATVRIIPPAGWLVTQAAALPLDRARNFALRQDRTPSALASAATSPLPLTITQSVIDFAPLIALGVGLGVVMAFGFLRTARAVSTSNRALALLFVRMQRTSERPLTFESDEPNRATDARVLTLLNQAGLDAAGQPLNIDRVLSVTAGDRPAIIALGQDGRAAFVVFTPMEAKAFQRALRTSPESSSSEVAFEHATAYPLGRLGEVLTAGHATAYPLDALNSGLFVADDLAAAYAYLASDLPVSVRTLPRTSRWMLFVAPLPRHDLAVRSSWRQRLGRRRRL